MWLLRMDALFLVVDGADYDAFFFVFFNVWSEPFMGLRLHTLVVERFGACGSCSRTEEARR